MSASAQVTPKPAKKKTVSSEGGQKAAYHVEMWDINRPIEYARNARVIPQSSIDKVAASVAEFGFRQPIVVDERDVILAGHTRLLAAKKLRLKRVPVHVAAGLTKAQAKAYRLADNRTGAESSFDIELLGLELAELKDFDFDLDLTGFDESELAEYLGDPTTDPIPEEHPASAEGGSGGIPEKKSISLTAEQYELVMSAIDKLRKAEKATEMSDGRALELICGDFIAG